MEIRFLLPNDPRLREVVAPVSKQELASPDLQKQIDEMLTVGYGNQGERTRPVLVGLAANQIGIMKRIILVDTGADGRGHVSNLRVFINPEIIWRSPETSKWYEGCYSTSNVTGIVPRPRAIRIRATTPDGREIVEKHAGYVARIFQHEVDHLDGKVFIDRISEDKDIHWVKPEEYPLYRDQKGWGEWKRSYPRTKWEEMRNKPL